MLAQAQQHHFKVLQILWLKKYNAKIQTIPMPQQLKGQYQSYTCADLTELNKNVTINYKTVEQYLND